VFPMNSNFVLRLAGMCGAGFALALTATAQEAADAPRVSSPARPALAPSNVAAAAVAADTSPVLTRAEAQEKIALAKRYMAHPPRTGEGNRAEPLVNMPEFDIAIPPPAPRAETKPAAPAADQVWVAGHYMPVEGEWRWVRGEWAVPATPISVWIPARYDEKRQKWAPGYWQPDVPTPAPEESPTKSGKSPTPDPYGSASANTPAASAPSR
jgi:hypothetical protein